MHFSFHTVVGCFEPQFLFLEASQGGFEVTPVQGLKVFNHNLSSNGQVKLRNKFTAFYDSRKAQTVLPHYGKTNVDLLRAVPPKDWGRGWLEPV